MLVDGKDARTGIKAQGRKTIDDCLSGSHKYCPLLETVSSEYKKMPNNCRVVLKALLQGQDFGGMAAFHCLRNPCNMDPMSFHQPFLHYPLHRIKHVGFSFPETVGVVLAIEVLPNTAYYFFVAAEALHALVPSDPNHCHRGFPLDICLPSYFSIPVGANWMVHQVGDSISIGNLNFHQERIGKMVAL
jgi:hypothetical protein